MENFLVTKGINNIVKILKDKEVKQDLINLSQFKTNDDDDDIKEMDLKSLKLYIDYKTGELCVLTECKNANGKDVVKSVSYLIKDIEKDNKIPNEIEEALKDI